MGGSKKKDKPIKARQPLLLPAARDAAVTPAVAPEKTPAEFARQRTSGTKTPAEVARQKARSMAEQALQSRFPDAPRGKRRVISPTPSARRTPGSAGNPLPPKESKAPAATPEAPQVKKRATRRKRSTQS